MKNPFKLLILLALLAAATPSGAEEHLVATASNFRWAMKDLAGAFEARSGQRITPVFASTGQLYAQIINGAPFAAFFAADSERPGRLEQDGRCVAGSRFVYALGRLVLWSAAENRAVENGKILRTDHFRRLAIANPDLAPYGQAARQVLQSLDAWASLRERLVLGENVGQAFQFVSTGNAELGLLARSQVTRGRWSGTGSRWLVPADLHQPIRQEAIQLRESEAIAEFMGFVNSPDGRDIIHHHGYDSP